MFNFSIFPLTLGFYYSLHKRLLTNFHSDQHTCQSIYMLRMNLHLPIKNDVKTWFFFNKRMKQQSREYKKIFPKPTRSNCPRLICTLLLNNQLEWWKQKGSKCCLFNSIPYRVHHLNAATLITYDSAMPVLLFRDIVGKTPLTPLNFYFRFPARKLMCHVYPLTFYLSFPRDNCRINIKRFHR